RRVAVEVFHVQRPLPAHDVAGKVRRDDQTPVPLPVVHDIEGAIAVGGDETEASARLDVDLDGLAALDIIERARRDDLDGATLARLVERKRSDVGERVDGRRPSGRLADGVEG